MVSKGRITSIFSGEVMQKRCCELERITFVKSEEPPGLENMQRRLDGIACPVAAQKLSL